MSPLSKGLGVLFGLPVLLGIGFFYYFLTTGEDRMRSACIQVKPGMTFVQLKEFAMNHNLSLPGKDSGIIFMGELRSFGRHACRVVIEAGVVHDSDYSYTD